MEFRGFDSSIVLILKGWNAHVRSGFPRNLESSNLSRDNARRKIGRKTVQSRRRPDEA